jgi:superfamily I DNA and RNA helicase
MLVDEALDFPPSFLRLCYEMLDDKRRLVYAYDELQDLQGEALPPVDEIFGRGIDGRPRGQRHQAEP